ncbi:hybrid sensor histidine kinase/response regulator [Pirellulaceae bacterium SH501]
MNDFVVEANASIALVDRHLLTLETNPDSEILNEVFRAIHSIKGVAGFLGLDSIQSLAHEMESVFDRLRRRDLQVGQSGIDLLLKANDFLRSMVEDTSNTEGLENLLESLASLHETSDAKKRLRSDVATLVNRNLDAVESILQSETKPTNDLELASRSSSLNSDEIERVKSVIRSAFSSEVSNIPVVSNHGLGVERPIRAAARQESSLPPNGFKSLIDASIRVPVAVLEELVNLAGELVLSRNQLVRTIEEQKLKSLIPIGSRIDQVTTAMQDAIMHARMQQVGLLFNRFPRLVRDLNQKLSKRCKIVMEGADVELDKTVLEALTDPLTHLVRNSLDHGIESPEVRTQLGKNPEGTLQLKAFHDGGKVRIVIEDDGSGISRERLLRKAMERGLVSHEESLRMSDREVTQLIFRPGFSTAEKISDVSGRGVGMDVVRTNIERIGGTVDVESELGKGTSIHVTLPLTLAIVPSWIVRQDGFQFAIPEANVIEFLSLSREEFAERVDRIEGTELIRWRGILLPLTRMRDCLPPECRLVNSKQFINKIVVVETGTLQFGLAVEQVCDPEHVVVKPISSHLGQSGYLDGAAVLGDGSVAFILGMSGIAERARLGHSPAPLAEIAIGSESDCGESQAAVIVRRRNGGLAAIPRMVIQRIERVDPRSIQNANQRWIVPNRGGQLLVVEWEKGSIRSLVRDRVECCYVMVFLVEGEEVGLVVREIVDIRDIPAAVSFNEHERLAVVGTVLLNNEVVEVLDLFELADQHLGRGRGEKRPGVHGFGPQSWTNANMTRSSLVHSIPQMDWSKFTILLAEDTPFFQEQVKRFLDKVSFQVVLASDGAMAWEILNQTTTRIDLLLTDIDMPRMDGFELALKVRSCPRLQHLPIVAITSLYTNAAQRRGKEVGIDEWKIKLDRDNLIQCLQSTLILRTEHKPKVHKD